jgi:hypothetical protein
MKARLIALLLALLPLAANAQSGPTPNRNQAAVYTSYTQLGRSTDMTVSTTSQDEALGVAGPVAAVYNTGSNFAYVGLTNAASTITAAHGIPVPPGACAFLNAQSMTHIQAITATGGTTLQVSIGWGNAGACGGSSASGGGGGGAITIANGAVSAGAYVDGAIVSLGATSDTPYNGTGAASGISILKGLYSNGVVLRGSPGTTIGNVGLLAGTNAIGSVSLNAGSNTIGAISNTGFAITGTLPSFTTTQHFICDSGCGGGGGGGGLAVTYGGAIGTLGTPTGFKDASGNFQPALGDVTNGSWVNVKASVLPAGAATQTTLAAIQTALGTPFQAGGSIGNTSFGASQTGSWNVGLTGTLPAFAATPTFNCGTGCSPAVQPVSQNGTWTVNPTTQANWGIFAAGTTASGVSGSLSQGVALAAAPSYTTGQVDPLTMTLSGALRVDGSATTQPVSGTVTANLGTIAGVATAANQTGGGQKTQIVDGSGNIIGSTSNALNVNCANCSGGGGGGTSSNFAATFPTAGTAVGMSQGGNMVALTGTSGNLNVQCANCSGSGVSTADNATFTAGSSLFAGAGGIVQTTVTSNPVTAAHQGLFQMTQFRAEHVNLRDNSGNEEGVSGNPLQVTLANTGSNSTALNVAASSLPLPSGASTAALQTTGNGSLSTIANNTGNIPPLGQALAASSVPVVLTASQLTTLTPPAAITGYALDTTVQTTNTDIGAPGSTACSTDTGSCNLNALNQRQAQRLTTLINTMGSPFQAGGSIGNTSFGATQSGTWNINNVAGTISLPTGAATANNQLSVQGPIAPAAATATNSVLVGFQYNSTPPTFTNSQQGTLQGSSHGQLLVATGTDPFNVTNAGTFAVQASQSGTWNVGLTGTLPAFASTPTVNLGTLNGAATAANQPTNAAQASTTSGQTGGLMMGAVTSAAPTYTTAQTDPLSLDTAGNLRVNCVTGCSGGGGGNVNLTQLNTVALGSPSNYGTSPGAVSVQGVNAFITNTVAVAMNATPSLANGNGVVPTQGGAVLSATNPSFTSVTDGTNKAAVKAASTAPAATDPALVVGLSPNGGQATAALQTTGNTSLGTIATNTGNGKGSTGSAVPATASYAGAVSSGNLTGIIQADSSVPINVSTATTTQLVALSAGKKIYVTAADVVAGGTGNVTFEYGTGTNCATGTTVLTGAYPLTAQAGLSKGGGLGPVWVVPSGNALCVLTSAAVQYSGSVAYTQF